MRIYLNKSLNHVNNSMWGCVITSPRNDNLIWIKKTNTFILNSEELFVKLVAPKNKMYYLCSLLILINIGYEPKCDWHRRKTRKSNNKQEKSNSNEKTNFEDGSLPVIIVCLALCVSRPQTTRSAILRIDKEEPKHGPSKFQCK